MSPRSKVSALGVGALTPIPRARRVASMPSRELVSVQRQLKREIGRREAAQHALKQSERHYRELLEKSRRIQEHLRHLSHEILSAQQHERKRISRELHDEIGQTLTAVNVKLATLKKDATVNLADLKKKIASTQRLIEKSMNTVHRFARELRPPLLDDLGLIPALHAYMKAFTKRTRLPIDFKAFAFILLFSFELNAALSATTGAGAAGLGATYSPTYLATIVSPLDEPVATILPSDCSASPLTSSRKALSFSTSWPPLPNDGSSDPSEFSCENNRS